MSIFSEEKPNGAPSLEDELSKLRESWKKTFDSKFTNEYESINRIPIYDMKATLSKFAKDSTFIEVLKNELIHVLDNGPGFFYCKNVISAELADQLADTFDTITDYQNEQKMSLGDSFGDKGAADRVWRALDELAVLDPKTFVNLSKNKAIEFVTQTWLGPRATYTGQINKTCSGAAWQVPHQDYQLGFELLETRLKYPSHHQKFSKYATLQIGLALEHVTKEMGPTMFAAFTNATKNPYFIDGEAKKLLLKTQEELPKGGMVVFNPCVTHAAGRNNSPVPRRVLLFQNGTGSACTMDTQDFRRKINEIYPLILEGLQENQLSQDEADRISTWIAQPYSYPTDSKCQIQKKGDTFPPSQIEIVQDACRKKIHINELNSILDDLEKRNKGFLVADKILAAQRVCV